MRGSSHFRIKCVTMSLRIKSVYHGTSQRTMEDIDMGDFYTEQLIKKQGDMKDLVIKAVLVAVAIVSVLTVFIFPMGLLFPIIIIALVWFLISRLNVEYEYLYVNGDLDIDKIMNKSKRKRVFSTNVKEMELLAPVDSPKLGQFGNAKVINLSSGRADARLYAMVVANNGQTAKLIFEPNDTIIEGLFMLAPRKVVRQ